jgi:TRAP-type C4-dicarboxylate transport system permease small subunit
MRAELLFVRVPMHVLAVVMLAGVALNFVNVIARYFFNAPIFWAEEVLVYAMIWAVFLALPAITFSNDHLRMDLLYLKLPGRLRVAVDVLCALLYVGFGAFAAYHSGKVVALLAANRQASVTAELPMAVVHAALPVGLALMVLAVAVRVFSPGRNGQEAVPR